jgi:hypothetical protein
MFVLVHCGLKNVYFLQLHNYDMCIAKNEEAIAINPRFAECYGNMANAWKVFGQIIFFYSSFEHLLLILRLQ